MLKTLCSLIVSTILIVSGLLNIYAADQLTKLEAEVNYLKSVKSNPMTSKPYHIFVEHITKEDLAYCRKDENCIDIMEIDDLCNHEQLGLPTK